MKKASSTSRKSSADHVLGQRAFAAISAVEGLALSPVSLARLEDMEKRGLSQDQKRAEIIRAYRATKAP